MFVAKNEFKNMLDGFENNPKRNLFFHLFSKNSSHGHVKFVWNFHLFYNQIKSQLTCSFQFWPSAGIDLCWRWPSSHQKCFLAPNLVSWRWLEFHKRNCLEQLDCRRIDAWRVQDHQLFAVLRTWFWLWSCFCPQLGSQSH